LRPAPSDASGRYLYVTRPGQGEIVQYSINQVNGSLTPMIDAAVNAGNSVQSIAIDPNGKYGYAVNLLDSTITQYKLHTAGM
jgi:6-phosphogluconolactonase (cycloisomerase 2 family)